MCTVVGLIEWVRVVQDRAFLVSSRGACPLVSPQKLVPSLSTLLTLSSPSPLSSSSPHPLHSPHLSSPSPPGLSSPLYLVFLSSCLSSLLSCLSSHLPLLASLFTPPSVLHISLVSMTLLFSSHRSSHLSKSLLTPCLCSHIWTVPHFKGTALNGYLTVQGYLTHLFEGIECRGAL